MKPFLFLNVIPNLSSLFGKWSIILPLLILSYEMKAQTYRTQQNQLLAYNIISNGLMGGIGGMINKPKEVKWHKAFLNNFGKGCLGGLVKYSAKRNTRYQANENFNFLALPNRLFFFAGHSMVMNAALNKKVFDTYYLNLYGADIRYQRKDNNKPPFHVKLSLMSVVSFVDFTIQKHTFDLYRSLEMGIFYFDMDPDYQLDGVLVDGIAGNNTIGIKKHSNQWTVSNVIPHEIVHVYQVYDFFPITNIYYSEYLEKPLSKYGFYTKLQKYMAFDFDAAYFSAAYLFQPVPAHYKNFFEFEAEHFSSRNYIKR